MEFLELALQPTKANLRLSPFSHELPPGLARRLEYIFGDRASAASDARAAYARDAGGAPHAIDKLTKREAWAVVYPRSRGDVFAALQFANDTHVPLTPRGGATSLYGGATPTEGGVVVDMRGFDRIIHIDAAAKTVKVEAGVTLWNLERALNKEGLALRQYPSTARGATVGGFIAEAGAGVGSLAFGGIAKDVRAVELIAADGTVQHLEGENIELAVGTHGIAGFITEVTLAVRENTEITPVFATFDGRENAAKAVQALATIAGGYSLHLFTPEYADQVNAGLKTKRLPGGKWSVLVAVTSGADSAGAAMKAAGGTAANAAQTTAAWAHRLEPFAMKRLGPDLIVGEAVASIDTLDAALKSGVGVLAAKTPRTADPIFTVSGVAISATEMKLTFTLLSDEMTGPQHVLASGNVYAFRDAVKKTGGRAFSTGVILASESTKLLGKSRLASIKAFLKETDPREIMNPGPVFGARVRGMPFRTLDAFWSVQAPMLKAMRTSGYLGGEKTDVSLGAVGAAIGRVNAGDLAEIGYAATSCSMCGNCNDAAPNKTRATWEFGLPRGRVQTAHGMLRGTAAPSRAVHEQVARTALSRAEDAACPSLIPISRVTDLLLATYVDALGALPAQAALADAARAEGNVYGKPRDKRSAWVNVAFNADARYLYLADDVAAYEALDVARNAAVALVNAGFELAHLGKHEVTSGAALIETGQRDAFFDVVTPMLEEAAKADVDIIVTPDANAMRAIRNDWGPALARADIAWRPASVEHSSTALARAVKAKRLTLENAVNKKFAIHVPEGFTDADTSALMELVAALPGAEVVDVVHHDCGHGRSLESIDADLQSVMAEACLKNVLAAGADTILTASPGCFLTLSKATKKAKAGVEVLELHAVVAQSMKMAEGGMAAPVAAVATEEEVMVEPEIPADHYRVEFVKEHKVLAVSKTKSILDAAEEAGLELPSSCRAGSCDTCSAKWTGTAADQSAGEALSADQQKEYVLTCIARPKGPIKIWSDERP